MQNKSWHYYSSLLARRRIRKRGDEKKNKHSYISTIVIGFYKLKASKRKKKDLEGTALKLQKSSFLHEDSSSLSKQ